jgi:hypothetical protein
VSLERDHRHFTLATFPRRLVPSRIESGKEPAKSAGHGDSEALLIPKVQRAPCASPRARVFLKVASECHPKRNTNTFFQAGVWAWRRSTEELGRAKPHQLSQNHASQGVRHPLESGRCPSDRGYLRPTSLHVWSGSRRAVRLSRVTVAGLTPSRSPCPFEPYACPGRRCKKRTPSSQPVSSGIRTHQGGCHPPYGHVVGG